MTYRETTREPPLVLAQRRSVLALDAKSGARLWEVKIDDPIQRLLVVERSLFVICGEAIRALDLLSGEQIGTLDLAFKVTAALSQGHALYLAGTDGAACITTDGRVEWQVEEETIDRGFLESTEYKLVCRDGAGDELWSTEPGPSYIGEAPALLLGNAIAQPELDRW